VKHICCQGLKYVLGDGQKIRFWWEVWLGDFFLKKQEGELPLLIIFNIE
jgi:hypothetical protein